MNTFLLYTMAVVAFTVTIIGGLLLAVLLLYGIYRLIASIWERTSQVAKNTKEYLMDRSNFELYKRDVDFWDELRRKNVEKCARCDYRRKYMEEDNHDE